MTTQLIIISVIITALVFLGLGFNIFFRQRKFPETHIGQNKEMRKKGVSCVKCDEMTNHINSHRKINPKKLKIILR